MPEIELTFELDGKTVHKKTKGFTGQDCVEKSKFIEDALGKPGGEKVFTGEYYEEQTEEHEDRLKY